MTQKSEVLHNAKQTILPYHIFKRLTIHAVLESLLPGKTPTRKVKR